MRFSICSAAFALALLTLTLSPLQAAVAEEVQGEPTILAISVAGNRNVEEATILATIRSKVGDRFDRRQIGRDVRELFNTGLFADVRVVGDPGEKGVRLTFEVKENPLIAAVVVSGNEEVKEKELLPRLKLKAGRVFSPALAEADRNLIRRLYLKKGYYQVAVHIEQKARDDGRIDLAVSIDEGAVTRVRQIRFVGNDTVDDAELRAQIASTDTNFMAWFNSRNVFERERLGADAQLIEQYYQNHGYLDAKVESTQVSFSSDKSWFYLTFTIHEGPQYRIRKIELQGDLIPDRDTLTALLTLKTGEFYSLIHLGKSIEALTQRVGDEGFAFATVTPLFQRDLQSNELDIVFDIEKGREVYVERVDIAGNQKTAENVLRREMRQDEAARYGATNVNRSKERLKRLPLFSDVRLSMPRGDAPDTVRLKYDVTEQKTGSFTFGVGYSQLEKTFIRGKISENNLFGQGYAGSFDGDVGARTQNFNLSLTDPRLFNEEMSGTFSLYRQQTKQDQVATAIYKMKSFGGGLNLGIPLSEYLNWNPGFRYAQSTISDVMATASLVTRSQLGTQRTGEAMQSLTWDTRDSTMRPNEGSFDELFFSVAGVGGDNRFVEGRITSKGYFPVGEKITFNPAFEAQYIRPYGGRPLPLSRRYSLGGMGSVRGFNYSGISLRDPTTKEALGGDRSVNMTMNLFMPMPYVRTEGFRTVLFADAGMVGGSGLNLNGTVINIAEPLAMRNLRISAGFGFEWLSPIGPLAFTWGYPLRSRPGDVLQTFEFAVGGGI